MIIQIVHFALGWKQSLKSWQVEGIQVHTMKDQHTPRSDLVPFAGDSLERSYLFYDRLSTLSSNAPAFRGQSWLSGFCCANRLCIRSPCHCSSRMRTFDENSCAISITSPRSLHSRTQQVWWDHREKYRRASTLWDCRGKSGKWDLMWTQG